MRRSRLVVLGLVLALAAAGCGSRTTRAQKLEALGAGRNGGTGAGTQSLLGGDNGGGSTDNGSAAGAGGATSSGGSATGAASSGGSSSGGSNAGAAKGGFSGDNGGSTDVGVTGNSITVSNVSILTGPVPGLFAGAFNGTDAYFQYVNSQGGVYGRQLKVLPRDDQFDCGQNKTLTESDIPKVFAFVGSFSLYDNCGAQVLAAHPDVPDVHNALSIDAAHLANNYSPQPLRTGAPTGPFDYFKAKQPGAISKTGSLVGDVQSAKDAWVGIKGTMQKEGYGFVYDQLYSPTQTDFTADIVSMRSAGVQTLVLVSADVKGIARIAQQAQQQNWHPQLTILGASAYDPQLIPLAGADALEGMHVYLPTAMYLGEDRGVNAEVNLFLTWLKKTHPSANPDLFTVYGWTSARLFVQALQAAGPQAKRATLIGALKNIHQFDSNGILGPGDPAGKGPDKCYVIVDIKGGKFVRASDSASGYRCDGVYNFVQQ
jgi:ABC-type branched-subunit amino acid transport system substrate-binding protein